MLTQIFFENGCVNRATMFVGSLNLLLLSQFLGSSKSYCPWRHYSITSFPFNEEIFFRKWISWCLSTLSLWIDSITVDQSRRITVNIVLGSVRQKLICRCSRPGVISILRIVHTLVNAGQVNSPVTPSNTDLVQHWNSNGFTTTYCGKIVKSSLLSSVPKIARYTNHSSVAKRALHFYRWELYMSGGSIYKFSRPNNVTEVDSLSVGPT